jgi:SAM-dependent methyltransferase
MPMSSSEGKDWIHKRIARLAEVAPVSVVDVGPGVGTYAKLLADVPTTRVVGIEVWEPYVATYRLHDYYDEIVIGDVREVDLPAADVVILGDVVEHMTRDDAVALWRRVTAAAGRAVYLSIPIVHYPQDSIEDNPYEVHVEEDWSHEDVLATFPNLTSWELGREVGVYEYLVG